jgi:hypothetical protein
VRGAAESPARGDLGHGQGLPALHIVSGKHIPQEDQAPATAQKIAELAAMSSAGPGV